MPAVITADIVNFSLMPVRQGKKVINSLQLILQPHRYEFYRGDSFQVYVKDPLVAFPLVLLFRSLARSSGFLFDIRASIGIGKVNVPVRALKTAGGQAFVLSGRSFDELRSQHLCITTPDVTANNVLKVISWFTDHIFEKLTPKQAEVFLQLLQGKTQMEIARKLKKSQSTVNKHVQTGNWSELERLIQQYQLILVQFNLK